MRHHSTQKFSLLQKLATLSRLSWFLPPHSWPHQADAQAYSVPSTAISSPSTSSSSASFFVTASSSIS